jgi:hypothetical protein
MLACGWAMGSEQRSACIQGRISATEPFCLVQERTLQALQWSHGFTP